MKVQKVKKALKFWAFLAVLGLMGCWRPRVITHPLPQPCPTQMVLKGSVYKVQKALNQVFKGNPQGIFQKSPNFPPTFTLYWKGDRHPAEIKIFKNPVNENDVYISCNRNPVCKSEVYTDFWETPLEFIADFQVHLIPQGAKETLVEADAISPQVVAGKTLVDVRPTTVEENEILTAVKNALGK